MGLIEGTNIMENNKLFYQDSYIQTFTSKITKQEKDENGFWYIVLEETAFYPSGGGQPFDTGTLNNIRVLNVEDIDGEIRHYMETPIIDSNVNLEGQINWERRFDHMQQHAGQHILSAAFDELLNYKTVSFHLGEEILTIDLDIGELTDCEAVEVEKRANQIIIENRPIETRWISQAELSQYPLRKQPTVTENIRLVIIPEFDYNGCGGTHPSSTGQVGAIKILDWEKQRKKLRIRFVCGNRVLRQFHNKHHILSQLTKLLNAPEQGMINSLERLLENVKSSDKQLEEARQSLLQFEAKDMIHTQLDINGHVIVSKVLQNCSMKEMQQLARIITNISNGVIVILISENESQLQVVTARGFGQHISMKELLTFLLPTIKGKGGGNEVMAQGGGDLVLTGNELLEIALNAISVKTSIY
jgi:alanyl-tRNA synthetase